MTPSGAKHSRLSLARRLRLQQLAIFEKVVEAGSILAASRELAMTQPAVSKSIHELEQQLDGVLFVRGKRGVVLTEFGCLFQRHTKILMGELRYLAEDLNAWQTGTAGHVVVGSLIAASATLLPEAITRLRAAVPDVVVTVRVGPNSVLFPALARGELDVVVGALPAEDAELLRQNHAERAELEHVALYEEALCVVVGSQHALAARRQLCLSELHALEWIVPTQDSAAHASVRSFFKKAGLAMPRRLVESVSILTNLGLVSAGSMVALMPQSAAERFAQAGLLAILPLEGLSPFSSVGYTVRADRGPSAATEHLLEALRGVGRSHAAGVDASACIPALYA
ncbi:LysR substrate-binding domain-containing protein [Variovorax saccharolyticus]|uniref:LysR substrate-binding domain-containing protein n=1 Tax=Variovorax saccharolyticus TaxID=3053516 RepID=UPI002574A64D|nr:LysR substrate-binding domain-containing protein [Variovorax sp. J22R187]MDM0019110.1 LysR substrate-binding domain-containing protein [Variovorax sp. J22R187]